MQQLNFMPSAYQMSIWLACLAAVGLCHASFMLTASNSTLWHIYQGLAQYLLVTISHTLLSGAGTLSKCDCKPAGICVQLSYPRTTLAPEQPSGRSPPTFDSPFLHRLDPATALPLADPSTDVDRWDSTEDPANGPAAHTAGGASTGQLSKVSGKDAEHQATKYALSLTMHV